jgi:CHAD domain-containing protein
LRDAPFRFERHTGVSVERERELKFEIAGSVEVGDLAATVPSAARIEESRRDLRAIYYDTADFRLARWGCTIRNRSDAGWVVKLPVPGDDVALVRDEVHFPPDGHEPPDAALRLVASFTRTEPVSAAATLTTDRRATRFVRDDASLVAELVDDRVSATTTVASGGHDSSFREIEVELGADTDPDAISLLVERLESIGCVPGGDTPKFVRAIGPQAAGPPDVVVPEVSEWATGREVVHAAIARSVRQLVEHLPVARLGKEPEGVHQSRVAIRRLRSDLRTFRALIDPIWRERIEPELKWMGKALGHVRDDDVLLSTLAAVDHAAPLMYVYQHERMRHHAELLGVLDDARSTQLLDDLVDAAHDPPTAPHADDPAPDLMRPILRKRWRKLRKAVQALGPAPRDEELHAVRIQCKKCRYALEAMTPAFGPPAKDRAKAIAAVQDVLGDLNDAAVISARLEGTHSLTSTQAFAAGKTAAYLVARAGDELPKWRKAWKKAASKSEWTWL